MATSSTASTDSGNLTTITSTVTGDNSLQVPMSTPARPITPCQSSPSRSSDGMDVDGQDHSPTLSCSCGSSSSSLNSSSKGFTISQRLRANKRRAFRRDSETQFAFYERVSSSSSSYSDSEDEWSDHSCSRPSTTVILCKKDDGWVWSQESFFPSYMRDRYSCSLSTSDGGIVPSPKKGSSGSGSGGEEDGEEGGDWDMDEEVEVKVEDIYVTEEDLVWFRT